MNEWNSCSSSAMTHASQILGSHVIRFRQLGSCYNKFVVVNNILSHGISALCQPGSTHSTDTTAPLILISRSYSFCRHRDGYEEYLLLHYQISHTLPLWSDSQSLWSPTHRDMNFGPKIIILSLKVDCAEVTRIPTCCSQYWLQTSTSALYG